MGFKTGGFAKVWKSEDKGNYSVVDISTSKKNTKSGEFETDFSNKFVRFIGKAHTDIKNLADGSKIKLGDIEVTNSYNKETKVNYTNFMVFSFEVAEGTTTKKAESTDGFMSIPDNVTVPELPFS